MKFRWLTGIAMAGALAVSGVAQSDHPQSPGSGGVAAAEPSDDPAISPNTPLQPQDALKAYEQQMATITVQAYTELVQIAEAVHSGQISSAEAEHLTRRCFEASMIRLQFLDTMHQIAETRLLKEGKPADPQQQKPEAQTSDQTLIVVPPSSSPDIPEAMAKYLELTPPQLAAIQARIREEQESIQPLLHQLEQNRKTLTTATEMKRASDSQIRKLAVEQSRILERLIVAKSRLQRDVYEILTAEQRRKLAGKGHDIADMTLAQQ